MTEKKIKDIAEKLVEMPYSADKNIIDLIEDYLRNTEYFKENPSNIVINKKQKAVTFLVFGKKDDNPNTVLLHNRLGKDIAEKSAFESDEERNCINKLDKNGAAILLDFVEEYGKRSAELSGNLVASFYIDDSPKKGIEYCLPFYDRMKREGFQFKLAISNEGEIGRGPYGEAINYVRIYTGAATLIEVSFAFESKKAAETFTGKLSNLDPSYFSDGFLGEKVCEGIRYYIESAEGGFLVNARLAIIGTKLSEVKERLVKLAGKNECKVSFRPYFMPHYYLRYEDEFCPSDRVVIKTIEKNAADVFLNSKIKYEIRHFNQRETDSSMLLMDDGEPTLDFWMSEFPSFGKELEKLMMQVKSVNILPVNFGICGVVSDDRNVMINEDYVYKYLPELEKRVIDKMLTVK